MTSFFDGFTREGIFGDLRRPGAPDRIFEEESEDAQLIEEGGELGEQTHLRGSGEKSEGTGSVQRGKLYAGHKTPPPLLSSQVASLQASYG